MEEHEITFLPKFLPQKVLSSPAKEILDIYLPQKSTHPILRIRKSGNSFEITKKQPIKPEDSSHQLETTIQLTDAEFHDLAKLPGKIVRKIRHIYKESKTRYEIDFFQDNLKGLVLVDVEFKTQDEKWSFILPNWCLREVTQEKFIAGGNLAGKNYSEIQPALSKFNYTKIL